MEFNTIGYMLSKQVLLLEEAYIFITEMDGDLVINETSLYNISLTLGKIFKVFSKENLLS